MVIIRKREMSRKTRNELQKYSYIILILSIIKKIKERKDMLFLYFLLIYLIIYSSFNPRLHHHQEQFLVYLHPKHQLPREY
jgi:hypothetical protein